MKVLTSLQPFRGSHASAYLSALSRAGHMVYNVDPLLRRPNSWGGWNRRDLSAIALALRPLLQRDLDASLGEALNIFRPDLFFTVKGIDVSRGFLGRAADFGVPTVNFFPDVTMSGHGSRLASALPHYSWLFTSKQYGLTDLRSTYGRTAGAAWVPHGFDPLVHRPVPVSVADSTEYGADVVFVGTWSPKKEALLAPLARELRTAEYRLRIWGDQWDRRSSNFLDECVQGRSLVGDEYALALSASKVALGLLSERRPGASQGDDTTTRTFEIPACGTAMIHEDSDELRRFFSPDEECFIFEANLVDVVLAVLRDDDRRVSVAAAGHRRAIAHHSVDHRLAAMMTIAGFRP